MEGGAVSGGCHHEGVRRLLCAIVLQAAEDVCVLRRMGIVIGEDGRLVGSWPRRKGKRCGDGDSDGGGYKLNYSEAFLLGRWIVGGGARAALEMAVTAGVDFDLNSDVEGCLLAAGLFERGGWEKWMKGKQT